ncbi:2-oxoglutarate and Fe(II)-dependent oxygenase family protein [Heterostelium album PN500]|uniref:2-oxoglutarate and Fe(II)-dependent oxygenase family protein n=1 Tax=Heterostelium pallidum (strain ATCC 26659 / Pp 5 / PN500) TaxID=670386 RepID=D3AVJ5_HETP5|nr:2-oxoglutarate and Fe(II)-dependent oxygenase family protein [Heterostelium album PN500]EFA86318.1 2-oxoglutarate and Fe(II)-dependent oxygenase family protein [Heterostelium album PN500]|eukprot:XP_020438423.1 2-oxoglutarate and Fe(II)-dependent oxygenase family protein [Heterostelium album PN500]
MSNIKDVDGLRLIENFITEQEENSLIENIDRYDWSSEIARRTQQYGYHYCYRLRGVDELNDEGAPTTPPIPEFLNFLIDRLAKLSDPVIPFTFDQVIINEYNKNQKIQPHIDSVTDWESTVDEVEIETPLPRRSLLVLQDDARYVWKHGIKSQNNGRRVSLTFRKYKS